ncbi:MAG TPA: hypothetical protein VMU50_20205, partial [Polyangia bacterium]|nr:hypothetical protein [Polyangia bacterium]
MIITVSTKILSPLYHDFASGETLDFVRRPSDVITGSLQWPYSRPSDPPQMAATPSSSSMR